MAKKFNYRKARKVSGWGCHFDSLTELKFAIAVMDDYYILREPISIYYHPTYMLTTERLRGCHLRYTPDFLIRHKQTHKAWLIEIKPRAFENEPELLIRRSVAENYIRYKSRDWNFRVVFDDKIVLNEEQFEVFQTASSLDDSAAITSWFLDYCARTHQNIHSHKHRDWIILGNQKNTNQWKQLKLL